MPNTYKYCIRCDTKAVDILNLPIGRYIVDVSSGCSKCYNQKILGLKEEKKVLRELIMVCFSLGVLVFVLSCWIYFNFMKQTPLNP